MLTKWVPLLFFVGLFFSIGLVDAVRADDLIDDSFSPVEVYELSYWGTLGDIVKIGEISEINSTMLEEWLETPRATMPSVPRSSLPWIFKLLGDLENRSVNLPDDFLQAVSKLIDRMVQQRFPDLPIFDVVEMATIRWAEIKKSQKLGSYYHGYHLIEKFRNLPFLIQTSFETEEKINQLFHSDLKEPLQLKDLQPKEAEELQKLKRAIFWVFQESAYKNLRTGWDNNLWVDSQEHPNFQNLSGPDPRDTAFANCDEQAFSVSDVIRQFEKRGLLKHFKFAGRVYKEFFDESHVSTILQSRRNNSLWVVDRWPVSGSEEPLIQPLWKWALGKYTKSAIPSLGCREILLRK